MTDFSVKSRTFQGDSKAWLGSAFGVDQGRPGSIDLATFDTVTAFPNGFIPSGVVLASRASDNVLGKYTPGTNEVNEQQTITVTGTPTGGTFALTVNLGGVNTATIAVPFNSTAAQLQAQLEGQQFIDVGDVNVTGGPLPGTPLVVEFRGRYQDRDIATMTVNNALLTGGSTPAAAITTNQAGSGAGAGATGLDVAVGHLLMPVSTVDNFGIQRTTGLTTCAVFVRGSVRVNNLPTGHGLDDAARRALRHIMYLDRN